MNNVCRRLADLMNLISPHEFSFQFDQLASELKRRGMKIQLHPTYPSSEDHELGEVLTKKAAAITDQDFSAAADFRRQEKEILSARNEEDNVGKENRECSFEQEGYIVKASIPISNGNYTLFKKLINEYKIQI